MTDDKIRVARPMQIVDMFSMRNFIYYIYVWEKQSRGSKVNYLQNVPSRLGSVP